jgi:hypothetical protein
MENEKDPRNLVIGFDLLHYTLVEYGKGHNSVDIGQYLEDIFDRFNAYFPINFQPPKND